MERLLIKSDLEIIHKLFQDLEMGKIEYEERMGGLTNHTYKITDSEKNEYVVRIPGEGTEKIINRSDERISNQLACELGIDSEVIYFDENGFKISKYISKARTMSADLLGTKENIEKVAEVFRKLHNCGVDTGVKFEVFSMAEQYENVILSNQVSLFEDYDEVKKVVMNIKNIMKEFKPNSVPCHNDPLCENWIEGEDKLYLIDWEYAGMNEGMWDLADVSIEANFSDMQDNLLLEAYLEKVPTVADKKMFLANKIYLDYLWSLWGKTRVPFDGVEMEMYAQERYERLKKNIEIFEMISTYS